MLLTESYLKNKIKILQPASRWNEIFHKSDRDKMHLPVIRAVRFFFSRANESLKDICGLFELPLKPDIIMFSGMRTYMSIMVSQSLLLIPYRGQSEHCRPPLLRRNVKI